MNLFFVRHGTTDWNQEMRYQGQTNTYLNEIGIKQAHKTGEFLKGFDLQMIYCSDLSRCLQTAKIINSHFKHDIVIDKRLREISFGIWEGLTYNDAYAKYPDLVKIWFNQAESFQVPKGEAYNMVMERVYEAVIDITGQGVNDVAIVTHGGVIRALLYKLKLIKSDEIWSDMVRPGSVTLLDWNKQSFELIFDSEI